MAYGWRAGTQQTIERGLFRVLRKKASVFQQLATQNLKESFFRFKKAPILTGYTKDSSYVETGVGMDKMLIRFVTPNDKPAGDNKGGYAIFPFMGWSTSAKYGKRNWLKKAAQLTKTRITNRK